MKIFDVVISMEGEEAADSPGQQTGGGAREKVAAQSAWDKSFICISPADAEDDHDQGDERIKLFGSLSVILPDPDALRYVADNGGADAGAGRRDAHCDCGCLSIPCSATVH